MRERVDREVGSDGAVGDVKSGIPMPNESLRQPRPYPVGFSFAEADRDYVAQVAEGLAARGIRRYYDRDLISMVELWGKFGPEVMNELFRDSFATVIVFVSAEYLKDDETKIQYRAALDQATRESREYILPVRLKGSPLTSSLTSYYAVDAADYSVDGIVNFIVAKLIHLRVVDPAAVQADGNVLTAGPVATAVTAVDSVELDGYVRATYLAQVAEARSRLGLTPLTKWDRAQLGMERPAIEAWAFQNDPESRHRGETLLALDAAVAAKPVVAALGGRDLSLPGALYGIYRGAVHRPPEQGKSLDMLLVEAALAASIERCMRPDEPLPPLARFVLSVAAHQGRDLTDPSLSGWIDELGLHRPDAEKYLTGYVRPSWLLIELGDEAEWLNERHPKWIRAGVVGPNLDVQDAEECRGEDDLLPALRRLLHRLPWPRGLVVDIVAPRVLLDHGIEDLEIVPFDDEFLPLSLRHRPRLRWSRRWVAQSGGHVSNLRNLFQDRVEAGNWSLDPLLLPVSAHGDRRRIETWLHSCAAHPVILAEPSGASSVDILKILLIQGCGFVLWYPDGAIDGTAAADLETTKGIGVPVRRHEMPDHLEATTARRVVIWDDPDGRAGFPMRDVGAVRVALDFAGS